MRPIRMVTAVLGSVTRNSRVAWYIAGEQLYSDRRLPVVLTKQANVLSKPNLCGDPEIIPIEGEGNIFNRVRGLYEITYCYVLPCYGDTTKKEIETAKSLNVPVRYLKGGEIYQIAATEDTNVFSFLGGL